MDVYCRATGAFNTTKNASFNQKQLTGLAEKLLTLAKLNLGQEQPEGDDAMSRNVRALKRASDSLIVKASKFVTSYASKPYPLQLLLASTTTEEIRKFDKEVQGLLDRFAQHGITISPEVARAPATTVQSPTPRPTFWPRLLTTLAAFSLRPLVVINNNHINSNTTTLVASNVGNKSIVKMDNVANNNPSTTHVRGNIENNHYTDAVYQD